MSPPQITNPFEATLSDNHKKLEQFLHTGGNVNGKNDDGVPLIHLVIDSQCKKLVDLVLSYNPDLAVTDRLGRDVIIVAVLSGNNYALKKLMPLVSSCMHQDLAMQTPLHHAASTPKRGKAITLLLPFLEDFNVHMVNKGGNKPVDLAILNGCEDNVFLLTEAGGCIPQFIMVEWVLTPTLLIACVNNLPRVVKEVLGKWPEQRRNKQFEELGGIQFTHYAAHEDNCAIVRALLTAGADIDARTKTTGMNLFHLAALNGSVSMALVLQEFLVNFAAVDKNGNTPLHIAAMGNHKSMIKWLLQAGADKQVRNKEGERAGELARNPKLALLLA